MILAPVLDVARDPRWGRVEEDFGEDPYLTEVFGLAYVRGMQGDSLATDHTVIAEPKHFAAHGSPESGLNMSPVHAGEREVRTVMLKSFEPAIRAGNAMGVMVAYHDIDGVPCVANPWLLNKVLREEWGFKGFVLSDLGAKGLRARGGFEVSMEWKNGKLQSAEISNRNGGSCTVRHGEKTATLSVKPGEATRLNAELVSNN